MPALFSFVLQSEVPTVLVCAIPFTKKYFSGKRPHSHSRYLLFASLEIVVSWTPRISARSFCLKGTRYPEHYSKKSICAFTISTAAVKTELLRYLSDSIKALPSITSFSIVERASLLRFFAFKSSL